MKRLFQTAAACALALLAGCSGIRFVNGTPYRVVVVPVQQGADACVSYTHWDSATVWYWQGCGLSWGEILLLHDIALHANVAPAVVYLHHAHSGCSWYQVAVHFHVERDLICQYEGEEAEPAETEDAPLVQAALEHASTAEGLAFGSTLVPLPPAPAAEPAPIVVDAAEDAPSETPWLAWWRARAEAAREAQEARDEEAQAAREEREEARQAALVEKEAARQEWEAAREAAREEREAAREERAEALEARRAERGCPR